MMRVAPGTVGPWHDVPYVVPLRVRVHFTTNRWPDVEIELLGEEPATMPTWTLGDHRDRELAQIVIRLLNQLCAHAELHCPICPPLCAEGPRLAQRRGQEECPHPPLPPAPPRVRRRVRPGETVGYTADYIVLLGCVDPRGWGVVLPELDPDPRWVTVRWEDGAETLEDPALLGRLGTEELELDRYVGVQVGVPSRPWDRRPGGRW